MEPPKNKENHEDEVLDDHLEKIMRDFNEFKRTLGETRGDAMTTTPEDLIDMYITSKGVSLSADFNASESMLPQLQMQSAYPESMDNFNIDIDFQLTDEMTENTSPIEKTTGAESISWVKHVRYGDFKSQAVADHIMGSNSSSETVFHSVMKTLKIPGTGKKNVLQKACVNEKGKRATSRTYIKKRYLQIIETNGHIAQQMEVTNAKNRQAGAKARARKQAYKAYTWRQMLELRQKNERSLNLFTVAKGTNNLHPELRRAIETLDKSHSWTFMKLRDTNLVYSDLRVIILTA